MEDPSAVVGCPISLAKGSRANVNKPVHQCQNVNAEIEYSLGSAAKSTPGAPCTNRPLKCQHCKLVIASYSMAQHYADKHSSTRMPVDLAEAVALGKHEREHVSQLLSKRKAKNVCRGIECCPKSARGS